MEMKAKARRKTILSILLVGLGMANLSLLPFRIDLTSQRTYSLTEVSRELLSRLSGRVLIQYHVSAPLLASHPFAEQIARQVEYYARAGRGRIDVKVQDPQGSTLGSNLQRVGLRTDPQGFHSGITIEYRNQLEVIPWIAEPAYVEYLLTGRLQKMAEPDSRSVGLIVGGEGGNGWEGVEVLLGGVGFDVRRVMEGEEVPPMQVLLVIQGEGLSERAVAKIEGFLNRGGRALVLIDRARVDQEHNLAASLHPSSGLVDLLSRLGCVVSPSLIADSSCLSLPVQRGEGTEAERFYLPYPLWPRIIGEGFNRDHPITRGVSVLNLFWASPLMPRPLPGVRTTVLARSGHDSWLMGPPFVTDPFLGKDSRSRSLDRKGSYPVAVLTEMEKGKLLVVGDSEWVGELVERTQSYENYTFLVNALEWLSNPKGLMEIRNRFLRDLRLSEREDPLLLLRMHAWAIFGGIIWIGCKIGKRIKKGVRA